MEDTCKELPWLKNSPTIEVVKFSYSHRQDLRLLSAMIVDGLFLYRS